MRNLSHELQSIIKERERQESLAKQSLDADLTLFLDTYFEKHTPTILSQARQGNSTYSLIIPYADVSRIVNTHCPDDACLEFCENRLKRYFDKRGLKASVTIRAYHHHVIGVLVIICFWLSLCLARAELLFLWMVILMTKLCLFGWFIAVSSITKCFCVDIYLSLKTDD